MMMKARVFGIGEVLWDLLPAGAQLGGAPANFAYHARALGADAAVISRVGSDELGEGIVRQFERLSIPLDLLQHDNAAPTGTVTVELEADGVPRFTIHENVAWDYLALTEAARAAMAVADAVCFGSLAQRCETSRTTVQRLVAAARPGALRIFDINLRQQFHSREVIEASLHLANVLKLNDAELPALRSMLELRGRERSQMETLATRFNLVAVALTRGPQGSLLLDSRGWSDQPGQPVQVQDTVGAGDAFTAAMTLGMLQGWDLDRVNEHANAVARHVCASSGATPPLPSGLTSVFSPL